MPMQKCRNEFWIGGRGGGGHKLLHSYNVSGLEHVTRTSLTLGKIIRFVHLVLRYGVTSLGPKKLAA